MTPGAMDHARNTRTPTATRTRETYACESAAVLEASHQVLESGHIISLCVEPPSSACNGAQSRDSISQLALLLDTSHTAQFACLQL
jgi:hypothetical protein